MGSRPAAASVPIQPLTLEINYLSPAGERKPGKASLTEQKGVHTLWLGKHEQERLCTLKTISPQEYQCGEGCRQKISGLHRSRGLNWIAHIAAEHVARR